MKTFFSKSTEIPLLSAKQQSSHSSADIDTLFFKLIHNDDWTCHDYHQLINIENRFTIGQKELFPPDMHPK